jgi:hypothetical protein
LIDLSAQSQADEHDLLQKAALNQDGTNNPRSWRLLSMVQARLYRAIGGSGPDTILDSGSCFDE